MPWTAKAGSSPIGISGYPKPEYGRNYVAMNDDGSVIAITGKEYVTIVTNGKEHQIQTGAYPNEPDNGYSGNTVSLSGDGNRILIGSKCWNGKKFKGGVHVSSLHARNSVTEAWKFQRYFTSNITSDYSCSSAKLSKEGKTVVISTFNPGLGKDHGETRIWSENEDGYFNANPGVITRGLSASSRRHGDQIAVSGIDNNIAFYEPNDDYPEMEDSVRRSMSFDCNFKSVAHAGYANNQNFELPPDMSLDGNFKVLSWRLQKHNSGVALKQSPSWNIVDQKSAIHCDASADVMSTIDNYNAMPVVSMACSGLSFAVIDPHYDFGAIIRKVDVDNTFTIAFPRGKPVAVAMNSNGEQFALSYKASDGSTTVDIYEWEPNQSKEPKELQNSIHSILPIFAFISIAFWFFVRRR